MGEAQPPQLPTICFLTGADRSSARAHATPQPIGRTPIKAVKIFHDEADSGILRAEAIGSAEQHERLALSKVNATSRPIIDSQHSKYHKTPGQRSAPHPSSSDQRSLL